METATYLDRAAVEALSLPLIAEFGIEIDRRGVKQVIGHMVKQIMEARGYEVDRSLRITRPGLFARGLAFRPKGQVRDRSLAVDSKSRRAWLKNQEVGPFNAWLDSQIMRPDDTIDRAQLYSLAEKWGVAVPPYMHSDRYSTGEERLALGVLLRQHVPPSEYEPEVVELADEECEPASEDTSVESLEQAEVEIRKLGLPG